MRTRTPKQLVTHRNDHFQTPELSKTVNDTRTRTRSILVLLQEPSPHFGTTRVGTVRFGELQAVWVYRTYKNNSGVLVLVGRVLRQFTNDFMGSLIANIRDVAVLSLSPRFWYEVRRMRSFKKVRSSKCVSKSVPIAEINRNW